MTYPLFVHVEFMETDSPKTPLVPVASVALGYEGPSGLVSKTFDMSTGDEAEHENWKSVSNAINQFTAKFPSYALVGWNLRNLYWPAIVVNAIREKAPIGERLLLPLTQKWNNLPLVDLRNLVLQGGFSQEEITLGNACWAITHASCEGKSPMEMTYDLYKAYAP